MGMYFTIAVILSPLLGAALAWLVIKARYEKMLTLREGELKTLNERLSHKETALGERAMELTKIQSEVELLRGKILDESKAAAAAIEKASLVPGLQARVNDLTERNAELDKKIDSENARIDEAKKSIEEKMKLLTEAEEKLSNAFKALSADTLKETNAEFLKLAKTTFEAYKANTSSEVETKKEVIEGWVKEVKESLEKIEKDRVGTYGKLEAQIEALAKGSVDLKDETSKLVNALRMPTVRGRWGEVQLRNIANHCGMLEHCDFEEQSSVRTEEGNLLRPDMVVKLPGGKSVVVDSKVSLPAYIEAAQTNNETIRQQKLKEHAAQIKAHVDNLSSKHYWAQFKDMPQFVFACIPNEAIFAAALEVDGTLIEYATSKRVVLATPSTLITLLLVASTGWREAILAENAARISEQGKILYERLVTFLGHFEGLRNHLDKAIGKFNEASSSLDSRVLPAARKMKELGVPASEEISALATVEKQTKELKSE